MMFFMFDQLQGEEFVHIGANMSCHFIIKNYLNVLVFLSLLINKEKSKTNF